MGRSVVEISRAVRRRLKGLEQKPSEHGRWAHAILLLWETENCVARIARRLYAARSSVQRWRTLYEEYGESGLRPLDRGRSEWKASEEVLDSLEGRWTPRRESMAISRAGGVRSCSGSIRRDFALGAESKEWSWDGQSEDLIESGDGSGS